MEKQPQCNPSCSTCPSLPTCTGRARNTAGVTWGPWAAAPQGSGVGSPQLWARVEGEYCSSYFLNPKVPPRRTISTPLKDGSFPSQPSTELQSQLVFD